jgi:hypothetical protein
LVLVEFRNVSWTRVWDKGMVQFLGLVEELGLVRNSFVGFGIGLEIGFGGFGIG